MTVLTLGTAQYVFRDLSTAGLEYPQYALMAGGLEDWFSAGDDYGESRRSMPGILEYRMNMAIARAGRGVRTPSFDSYPSMEHPLSVFDDQYVQCGTAIIFLDQEGQVLRESGDYLYFDYLSREQWETGVDQASACGWIDLSDRSDPRYSLFRTSYARTNNLWDLNVIRITGYLDGSRIEPLSMAISTRGAYYNALDAASPGWDVDSEPGSAELTISEDGKSATISVTGGTNQEPPYSASELDSMGLLEWEVRFDHTAQADPARELVSVYIRRPEMSLYQPEGPVEYQGVEYEDLLTLLKTQADHCGKGRDAFYSGSSQFDLWNMVVFSTNSVYDLRDHPMDGSEPFPEPEFTVMTAMQASPIRIAMSFLRYVYLVSFMAGLLGFLLLLSRIRRNLTLPLQRINQGIQEDWARITTPEEPAPRWQEPRELWEHYRETQDLLRGNKNELARLNTALQYARSAEQDRRQMTSNITHELKTPLAVIHSYAEGLKERIAEEKRDKYVDVILGEVQRIDAMVLQMLDLSRLEAGKVKLSRDEFCLSTLTRSILEKLEMAAAARELRIDDRMPQRCVISADENRISQVVENFVSNAVKYTPAGGHIRVTIRQGGSKTTFSIENDSPPLSPGALAKVWDTFYRADESRSEGGTGLGLAIAKNIVELHGGTCSVRNTKNGVEFSFTI